MVNERVRLQWLLHRLRATLTDADGHHAKSEGLAAWLRKLKVLACDIEDVLDEFEYQDLRLTVVEGEGGSSSVHTVGDMVSLLPPQEHQVVADKVADFGIRVNEIMEDKEALDMLGEFDDEEDEAESADSMNQLTDATFSVSETEMVGRDQEKEETVEFLLGSPMDDLSILEGKYTVHDLLHDLGRSILQRDFREVTSDQVQQITMEDLQKYHLSILHKRVDARDLAKLQKFWRLRTCLIVFSHKFTLQIPSNVFLNMTCLRVLDLSGGGIHALSDSIEDLKHLRYLDLRSTSLRYLPESLCSLYMLQTLRLQGCEELEKLPKDMCNLINLRHLEAKHELISGIFGIGRLIQLREIEVFSISEGNGIRIEDLKDMNQLRGKLCIRNLQRVGSREEASLANLSSKKYVKKLELEWAGDLNENERNSELEEAVLDALVPPPRLHELTIKYYAGEDFPCWMEHQFISGLESISLYRCQRWGELPPLVGLLPFLKKLEISYFPRLMELPSLPTTLTHLRLEGMGLTAVPVMQELPLLQELIMCNMPGLRELPPLTTALSVFKLEMLAALSDLPAFHWVHGGQTTDGVGNCRPQLRELKIAGCQNLSSLGGLLREQLPCLSNLSIENCEELVSWPKEDGFRTTLLSLQELSIRNCPKLMALPQGSALSPDMKKLTVEGCPNFPDSSFFAQMQDMKNLNRQGDVFVEKHYQDLRRCSEEALKHMRSVNWLIIQFIHQDGGGSPCLSLEYDIQQVVRRTRIDLASYRRIILKIMGNGNDEEEERRSTLPTCLGHHHLCSSLFSLSIHSIPHGASFLPQGRAEDALLAPNLPSLEELVLVRCNDMRRLPVETMLCHLRKLKQLSLVGCPELTFPSMEEALQSLPCLQKLVIIECAKLSLPNPDAHIHGNDDNCKELATSLSPPAHSSSSSLSTPPLRSLAIDDVELLANKQFTGVYLTFLHELALWYSDLCSFPASMDCLKSLHSLTLIQCPNLREFPPDFRSLFPFLEILCIKDCPRLRCVPEMGMPASLEVLGIYTSPKPEEDDWAKVAHVRLIIMERKVVQGKYSDYQDLLAKGKILLVPS
ncbi:hypothetical protein Taro_008067 [Colocasia esculenta]|uniref:Rx N-terminal domain-containing protein n=1 Tax=Colocasia esculenta TaxID=4460 RepID=A0A843U5U0_COLES|nr:hypothetical protein [Colocasia esculenta]